MATSRLSAMPAEGSTRLFF